jgi:hypothetical protein
MQFTLSTPAFMHRLFAPAAPARSRISRRFAAHVPHGATREITAPPGRMTVHCRDGEAWITHDGDPRDVTLRPNESYTADRRDRVTLHALRGDCILEIQVDD